jgi:hypothetical protein
MIALLPQYQPSYRLAKTSHEASVKKANDSEKEQHTYHELTLLRGLNDGLELKVSENRWGNGTRETFHKA